MNRKSLRIPYLDQIDSNASLHEISSVLGRAGHHPIDQVCWPQYPDQPAVDFSIAHLGESMIVQYRVSERETLARFRNPNDPVHRDSCVEFFVGFGEDGYYNFEFNSLGTCFAAFGTGRHDRTLLPVDALTSVRTLSERTGESPGFQGWQLTLIIPARLLFADPPAALSGRKCRLNFFKCGDELARPHFLAWNPVEAPNPDFHLPEFFGDGYFL